MSEEQSLILVFATQNENKAREIQGLLPSYVEVRTLKDINCHDDIPEEEPTLEGNAAFKAKYIYEKFGVNCFADDTGLEIDVLNGEPGVLSARYAGGDRSDENNMNLVLEKLSNKENREAQFKTVIALYLDGEEHLFEGIVRGSIGLEKKGQEGFGYDPLFIPEGGEATFAEMNLEDKNKISHRGRAIKALSDFLINRRK